MCGIAGFINAKVIDKDRVVRAMNNCIIHRGPDEDGYFVDDVVGLGMRRLSIIDLAHGTQPITSNDERKMIFFNGEIYNYKELKEELLKKGETFKTDSDTEVVLRMYEVYGAESISKLRGMFAFAIYNLDTGKILLARDMFGIKPLYFLAEGDVVSAFASEIKCFSGYPYFRPAINDAAVYNYLSFQYNPLEETFFQGVYKLPPAHYMEIDTETGEAKMERYWRFKFSPNDSLQEGETKKKILNTMKDSVAHHMIADVPVGSFLSGGIDSSIIATLMQQVRGEKKIKTFTVGFESLTEGAEARETAEPLGTDHKEITVSAAEYFQALESVAWHFDEPVADPSAVGLYFLAREARKEVKVVLSGEGSDELFGGYNIYLEPYARAKIAWIPAFILRGLMSLPFNFRGKNYLDRASQKLEDWYIGNASIFKPGEVEKIWKDQTQKKFSLSPLYKEVKGLSDPVRMQFIDLQTWLVGDILAKADKMTMAHSLELRVPFLDMEVAKLAETLPDNFKWRNGKTKYLLREAFKKVLPESTRKRKKLGFPTPVRNWFTKDKDEIYDLILQNDYIRSHMDTVYIKKIIDDHTDKKADNSRKIYLLLMFALWYNKFIKQ